MNKLNKELSLRPSDLDYSSDRMLQSVKIQTRDQGRMSEN